MEALTYVLPLRWEDDAGFDELTEYLRRLAGSVEIVVVDSSPPPIFERHAKEWRRLVRHVPPDPSYRFVNGKVNNVLSGVDLASYERVIVADDDVRYEPEQLQRVAELLEEADVVVPQNYFTASPWHALWDTARSILNRSFWHDFPGTLGVRRAWLQRVGGYDGDVLFENLELMRTCQASGGTVVHAPNILVGRIPPTTERFWAQRVRQAYDEFARPAVLLFWLAVLPLLGYAIWSRRWLALALAVAALFVIAEFGRGQSGGAGVFPRKAVLFAPVWVLERATCAWIAVWSRVARGGVRYAGTTVSRAATPKRTLRRKLAARDAADRPAAAEEPQGRAHPAV